MEDSFLQVALSTAKALAPDSPESNKIRNLVEGEFSLILSGEWKGSSPFLNFLLSSLPEVALLEIKDKSSSSIAFILEELLVLKFADELVVCKLGEGEKEQTRKIWL